MATEDARVPMTHRGYQFLLDELKRLKGVERPKIVREIEEARGTAICPRMPSFTRPKKGNRCWMSRSAKSKIGWRGRR